MPVNLTLNTVEFVLAGVANNLIFPEFTSNVNVERELFVNNVPYSLKYTFVPLWIARTLVTWYLVPSVIWIVYSADRYVATGKFKIAVGTIKGHNVEPVYFDIELKKGKEFSFEIASNHNSFIYLIAVSYTHLRAHET